MEKSNNKVNSINRTFFSFVIELFLRVIRYNRIFKKNKFEKYLMLKKNKKTINLFNRNFKNNLEKEYIDNNVVYSLCSNKEYNKIVIYVHGGAFINDITKLYLKMLDKLASNIDAKIYIPLYPLLPNNTYKDSFEFLNKLYSKLIMEQKEIIFMGDSAGAGLSLSFVESLKERNMILPSKLILISPWLDVSMSNNKIKDYECKDPILVSYGLKKIGKLWANDLDVKNYMVSPLYGDLNSLPSIFLTVGTREIFYPDIAEFYDKLVECNNDVRMIVGNKLNHIYPIFPTKEANKVLNEIYDYINK